MLPTQHPLNTLAGYGYTHLAELHAAWTERAKFYNGLFRLTMPCGRLMRLTEARCFCRRVCFDMDYARAFFLERNLRALMPHEPRPWKVLQENLLQHSRSDLEGDMYWLVLYFAEAKQGSIVQSYKFDLNETIGSATGNPTWAA